MFLLLLYSEGLAPARDAMGNHHQIHRVTPTTRTTRIRHFPKILLLNTTDLSPVFKIEVKAEMLQ
jgi:hypothetical protein